MGFPKSISLTIPGNIFEFIHSQSPGGENNTIIAEWEELSVEDELTFLLSTVSENDINEQSLGSELYFATLENIFPERALDLEFNKKIPLIRELLLILEPLFNQNQEFAHFISEFSDKGRLNFE